MQPNPKIAFTGHRPPKIGGYGATLLRAHIKTALSQTILHILSKAHADDVITFYSGMAQGVDQDAADIVLRQRAIDSRIRLIAFIPCLNQERPWPESSKTQYYNLIQQCDAIKRVTPDDYTPTCMQERNQAMVDGADYVIAVWDGTAGGTATTVHYAQRKGVPVVHLQPSVIWTSGYKGYAPILREVFP